LNSSLTLPSPANLHLGPHLQLPSLLFPLLSLSLMSSEKIELMAHRSHPAGYRVAYRARLQWRSAHFHESSLFHDCFLSTVFRSVSSHATEPAVAAGGPTSGPAKWERHSFFLPALCRLGFGGCGAVVTASRCCLALAPPSPQSHSRLRFRSRSRSYSRSRSRSPQEQSQRETDWPQVRQLAPASRRAR